jgi:hypothetical protein
MRRLIIAFCLLFPFAAASAEAITIRDIIELSRAGLSEDVLLALVEVDGGVFPIDTETLTKLKAAGVSQRVIVAIVRSGRTRPPDDQGIPVVQEPPPPPVVIERPTEVVREVAVPFVVPVYVPVPVRSHISRHEFESRSIDLNAERLLDQRQDGQRYLTDIPPPRKSEEVYWGFGGKLRPDAWKPR